MILIESRLAADFLDKISKRKLLFYVSANKNSAIIFHENYACSQTREEVQRLQLSLLQPFLKSTPFLLAYLVVPKHFKLYPDIFHVL